MIPEGDDDDEGFSSRQFRWLVGASVVVGALFLLLVVGVTVSSHVYGVGGGDGGPPDAEFEVSTTGSGDELVANVTHAGGDAISPDDLAVAVDGERRGDWSELGGEGLDIVAEGHTVTIGDVDPGQVVRILWVPDDADEVEQLGQGVVADR